MDPEYEKYVKDKRIPCKYGKKCYRRNQIHVDKYKHPPQSKEAESTKKDPEQPTKKMKIESEHKEIDEIKIYDTKDDDNTSEKLFSSGSEEDETTEQTEHNTEIKNDPKPTEEAPQPNLDPREFIKQKFLVEMPEDFYQFYSFCSELKPNSPLKALDNIGLTLVGPYDVLAKKFTTPLSDDQYLIHWRYFRDPPEVTTVLKGDDKTGFHIGYFRDEPREMPVFLVGNSAEKDGILKVMGENIFAAVSIYLEELKKGGDPFKKMHIGRIQSKLKMKANELGMKLDEKTEKIVKRDRKIVCRTFNKVGLVVPYDRKTQLGYRSLALDNKDLNTLLTKLENALPEQKDKYLSELQPVFTFANIAADECDFGTEIELGWDIIAHGTDKLNSTIAQFLGTGYRLLNREEFARIAEAHMKNRKKGTKLSVLD